MPPYLRSPRMTALFIFQYFLLVKCIYDITITYFNNIFNISIGNLTILFLSTFFRGTINKQFCLENTQNLTNFLMIILTRKLLVKTVIKYMCVKFDAFSR